MAHTHSASLEAPVPLVVRPDGHGLHVAWFATPAYMLSAHATHLLPKRKYPSGQEQLSKWPPPPLSPERTSPSFTIAPSVQLQLPMPTDFLADTLRRGQLPQLADPREPLPYWLAAQSTHESPAATVPIGHSQEDWPGSAAFIGTLPETQVHWLALDAPVPLVVRPEGHGLHDT